MKRFEKSLAILMLMFVVICATGCKKETYSVSVSASPSEGGVVTGDGKYQEGNSCTVNASVNEGYIFKNWTEGGNVVSTDAGYTFVVTDNRTLVANFSALNNSFNIIVSANPPEGGTVTGGGTCQQGQSCTITARANPGYTFVNWTENGNVVSTESFYTFNVDGHHTFMANFDNGIINDFDFSPSGSIDGYEYVDLGLSVKWATCNIGASTIEESGNYYAWQETSPVTALTHINYWYNYNPCSPDNILSSIYDAATVNLGHNWRMPTWEEMDELCRNCNWTWTNNFQGTGTSGCIIKSRVNSKSIFLPASGYINTETNQQAENERGFYWSSYAGPGDLWLGLIGAMDLMFYNGGIAYGGNNDSKDRSWGLPVRAVVGTPNIYIPEGPFPLDEAETNIQGFSVSGTQGGQTYVDLGLPSRTLWATYNVGANAPREYGNYYAWGETAPKELYTDTTYVFYDGTYNSGTNIWIRYSKYTWYVGHHGTVDGKLKLDPEDDAATMNIGSSWSMPTKAQFEELTKYVFWMQDGTSGWIGTSKINGHTIYIPSAGWEYNNVPNNHMQAWYWSSELTEPSPDNSDYYSWMLTNSPDGGLATKDTRRIQGLSVRGVTK